MNNRFSAPYFGNHGPTSPGRGVRQQFPRRPYFRGMDRPFEGRPNFPCPRNPQEMRPREMRPGSRSDGHFGFQGPPNQQPREMRSREMRPGSRSDGHFGFQGTPNRQPQEMRPGSRSDGHFAFQGTPNQQPREMRPREMRPGSRSDGHFDFQGTPNQQHGCVPFPWQQGRMRIAPQRQRMPFRRGIMGLPHFQPQLDPSTHHNQNNWGFIRPGNRPPRPVFRGGSPQYHAQQAQQFEGQIQYHQIPTQISPRERRILTPERPRNTSTIRPSPKANNATITSSNNESGENTSLKKSEDPVIKKLVFEGNGRHSETPDTLKSQAQMPLQEKRAKTDILKDEKQNLEVKIRDERDDGSKTAKELKVHSHEAVKKTVKTEVNITKDLKVHVKALEETTNVRAHNLNWEKETAIEEIAVTRDSSEPELIKQETNAQLRQSGVNEKDVKNDVERQVIAGKTVTELNNESERSNETVEQSSDVDMESKQKIDDVKTICEEAPKSTRSKNSAESVVKRNRENAKEKENAKDRENAKEKENAKERENAKENAKDREMTRDIANLTQNISEVKIKGYTGDEDKCMEVSVEDDSSYMSCDAKEGARIKRNGKPIHVEKKEETSESNMESEDDKSTDRVIGTINVFESFSEEWKEREEEEEEEEEEEDDLPHFGGVATTVTKAPEPPCIRESTKEKEIDQDAMPSGTKRRKHDWGRYKIAKLSDYTLDSLVMERKQSEQINKELKELSRELQQDIKAGGIDQLNLDKIEVSVEELCPEYRTHLGKIEIQEETIQERHSGEVVFRNGKYNCLFSYPDTLTPENCGVSGSGHVDQHLVTLPPDMLLEFIAGDVLVLCFKNVSKGCELLDWLFYLMSIHPKSLVGLRCHHVLSQLLFLGTGSAATWWPGPKHLATVLINYGADLQTLPKGCCNENFTEEILKFPDDKDNEFERPAIFQEDDSCYKQENLHNVLYILTEACAKRKNLVKDEDVTCLIMMLMMVSLDKTLITSTLRHDIMVCIAALLEAASTEGWKDVVLTLSENIPLLTSHHHNRLSLVQLLPPSGRCEHFRRRLAYSVLQKILWDSFVKEEVSNLWVHHLFPVMDYLSSSGTSKNIDFYLMSSVIRLADLAVGNETLPSSERDGLTRMTEKMRVLISDVKDYVNIMDRTMVKDLMHRILSKWTFMSQNMGKKQGTIFAWATQGSQNQNKIVSVDCSQNDDNSQDLKGEK